MARKKGTCFVIMPFGVKSVGRVNVNFDHVYEKFIEPAARTAELGVERADNRNPTGSITGDFLNQLYKADVVVADITYPNPNVFYELGIRHGLTRVGTVLVRTTGGDLVTERRGLSRPNVPEQPTPFDVKDVSILNVVLSRKTLGQSIEALRERILLAANQSNTDSPVFHHVAGLRIERVPAPASGRQDRTFEIAACPGRYVGYRSGDIANLKGEQAIDYWVNSENTQMLMARTVERSVSSTIRHHGAADPSPTSLSFEDTIADALKAAMGNKHIVGEGDVLVTTSGRLAQSHGVKAILHAATVRGVVGRGFESIADARLGECVREVLLQARQLGREGQAHQRGCSVALPLFGAGQARRDPTQVAGLLASAAIETLQEWGAPEADDIDLVVFCAYTQSDVDLMRRIFDSLEKAEVVHGVPRTALPRHNAF